MNTQNMKFHHIAIRARDYEASKEFYTEGLNARCYAQWKHPKGFMACMMELNGGGIIEMLGSGGEPLPENFEDRSGCYIHLALEVDDVEAAVAQAIRHGGLQKGDIKDSEVPSPMHIGTVYGPSGEIIEFLRSIPS